MTGLSIASAARCRAATSLLLTAALVIGVGLGVVLARADQLLNQADGALEKAAALIDVSEAGVVTPRTQRRFDRHLARALAHIERARAEAVAAAQVVDDEIFGDNGGDENE